MDQEAMSEIAKLDREFAAKERRFAARVAQETVGAPKSVRFVDLRDDADPWDARLIGLLRDARATHWRRSTDAWLACKDASADSVTPASLVRCFRDCFNLAVSTPQARQLALALGGDEADRRGAASDGPDRRAE